MIKQEHTVQAISKSHVLPGLFDPVELVKESTKDVLLLESADIITKLKQKSMLLLDLAVKIEARNGHVYLTALLPEALLLLERAHKAFADCVISTGDNTVELKIPPVYDQLDILAKMQSRSILDILRVVLAAISPANPKASENLMLSGVFAYDILDHFEKLPQAKHDLLTLPDFLFYIPLTVITIDHANMSTDICTHALVHDGALQAEQRATKRNLIAVDKIKSAIASFVKPLSTMSIGYLDPNTYEADVSDQQFGDLIERCKEHIKAGDVYQIVPSRTFSRPLLDPLKSYQALRSMNPSPYMFYVQTKDWTLFGASPETFIKVDEEGKRVSIRPIAGTRRRGLNPKGLIDEELDAREQVSLCLDEKELAEHMMLVDLARNDIASVAKPKSRRIKRLLGVDRFSHVMHLVSEVEGQLREGCDALSAYQASMNMGTLMGAPKVRAAELLRNLENSKRGFYGGAVGYINQLGDMDTSIIIRSAVVKDGRAYVRAGCGVVYDSERAFEVRETINKAEAVLKAMDLASRS